MKTSIKYLQRYANTLIDKYWNDMPKVKINAGKLPRNTGGIAYGDYLIILPKWILADKKQAMSTIRHELAHNLVNFMRLSRKISHGKEFHEALKVFSPKNWKYDLHWYASEAITEARNKMGIKPREHRYLPIRIFTCGNPDCPANPKHKWGFKRIPHYITRGLFGVCPTCGCPEMIEIDGKHARYTSIHGKQKPIEYECK